MRQATITASPPLDLIAGTGIGRLTRSREIPVAGLIAADHHKSGPFWIHVAEVQQLCPLAGLHGAERQTPIYRRFETPENSTGLQGD
jgi:hypothetical protein